MTLFVVGSLHLDVVMHAPHLPGLDETVTGHSVSYVFGGKGGNQAVAAARLGAQVAFAGRAGSDGFGDQLRSTLRAHHIDLSQLQQDTGPSGMSTAIIDQNGDYGAVIVSAANLAIDADDITIPSSARIVLLQNEIPQDVNTAIARQAKAAGAQVWLNAAPARDLPEPFLFDVDLLIVNRIEAAFYDALPQDLSVIRTLGSDGVEVGAKHYPAPQIKAVSSHGAGDMFVGALAAAVLSGAPLHSAIEFAQAAAALHVSSDQAGRSALDRARVEQFIKAYVSP